MQTEIAKQGADTTMKASIAGGFGSSFMAYLNVNAAALGLIVSLAGVLIATLFYWLNYRRVGINMVNEAHLKANHKRITELEAQVQAISDPNTKRE